MEAFKCLLFCMVLVTSGYDKMCVSGLDCLVCAYFKESPAHKRECESSSEFILPCNNEAEGIEAAKFFLKQIADESQKFVQDDINSRAKGNKFGCRAGSQEMPTPEKKKGSTGMLIMHACAVVREEDISSTCKSFQAVEGLPESNVYSCTDESKDGKPCNFVDKCKHIRSNSLKLSPFATGIYILILIGVGAISFPALFGQQWISIS